MNEFLFLFISFFLFLVIFDSFLLRALYKVWGVLTLSSFIPPTIMGYGLRGEYHLSAYAHPTLNAEHIYVMQLAGASSPPYHRIVLQLS